jgi:hypothetical protein
MLRLPAIPAGCWSCQPSRLVAEFPYIMLPVISFPCSGCLPSSNHSPILWLPAIPSQCCFCQLSPPLVWLPAIPSPFSGCHLSPSHSMVASYPLPILWLPAIPSHSLVATHPLLMLWLPVIPFPCSGCQLPDAVFCQHSSLDAAVISVPA